ncbi:TetR/AcrR family transcriptional regulator [Ochrobactrum sp. Kaboul]|nr:TetR/AcrR family transcriptional regulator [Ochrobactrum sp. Kaboul]HCJ73631.1 hypothetical protein [Agrobacterium sp.]
MSTSKAPEEDIHGSSKSVRRKQEGRFHHGALADAIAEAATRLIRERGSPDFSLREISALAGVSHAATYRHFRSKGDVIAEVATRGFRSLCASLQASMTRRQDGGLDALETLNNMAHAYVAFAATNPGTYRVLFHAEVCNRALYPQLAQAAEEAYVCLASTIGEACAKGELSVQRPPELLASAFWAGLHGHVVLLIDGQITENWRQALEGPPPADRDVLITLLLNALFRA